MGDVSRVTAWAGVQLAARQLLAGLQLQPVPALWPSGAPLDQHCQRV